MDFRLLLYPFLTAVEVQVGLQNQMYILSKYQRWRFTIFRRQRKFEFFHEPSLRLCFPCCRLLITHGGSCYFVASLIVLGSGTLSTFELLSKEYNFLSENVSDFSIPSGRHLQIIHFENFWISNLKNKTANLVLQVKLHCCKILCPWR